MTRRTLPMLAIAIALAGCAPLAPLAPPPTRVTTLSIAQVENTTGDALVVSGEWYVERMLGRRKRTVADVAGEKLLSALLDRGFDVVQGGNVPQLRVTLRRFDPDLPQLAFVSMSVAASLVAPEGTVLWSVDRTRWLVSTDGSPSLNAAYDTAAREMAEGLLRDWTPNQAAVTPTP